jgi:hypothetical protein
MRACAHINCFAFYCLACYHYHYHFNAGLRPIIDKYCESTIIIRVILRLLDRGMHRILCSPVRLCTDITAVIKKVEPKRILATTFLHCRNKKLTCNLPFLFDRLNMALMSSVLFVKLLSLFICYGKLFFAHTLLFQ